MPRNPVICLTLRGKPFDQGRRDPTPYPYEWLPNSYGAAIAAAGGIPACLSNECSAEAVDSFMDRVDGLFLCGGEDVAPEYYGESAQVDNLTIYPQRDSVELRTVAAADRVGMPILGVCRGLQVLNVARGGTLYQDLERQYPRRVRDHSRGREGLYVQTHAVELQPGCRLQRLLGMARLDGATSHHQAIRTPGRNLVPTGFSPEDGVIEAVEEPGDRFVVGVQWHPEVRAADKATVSLFAAFVEAAARFAQGRGCESDRKGV